MEALLAGRPNPIRDEFGEGAITTNPGTAEKGAVRVLRAAAPILQREEREEREAVEAKLADARYLGDNHHNATACPYCLADLEARLDSARAEGAASLLADLEAEVESVKGRAVALRRLAGIAGTDASQQDFEDQAQDHEVIADRLQVLIDKHKPNGAEEGCRRCGGSREIVGPKGLTELTEWPCPDCAKPEQGAEGEEQVGDCVIDGCDRPGGHRGPHWSLIDAPYQEDRDHTEPWEDDVARELAAGLSTQPSSETNANPGKDGSR